jgi:flagellar biogenesis protein FliO
MKSDPDIKGIMVRQVKKSAQVEIRVRYRSRVSQASKRKVKVLSTAQGIEIKTPRRFEAATTPSEVRVKTSPKPSLDPKLNRIKKLSSTLSDDTSNVPSAVRTPSTQARPSVFERGAPVAPLPRLDPVRAVQNQMTTPPKSQAQLGSQQGLKALPINQGQMPVVSSTTPQKTTISTMVSGAPVQDKTSPSVVKVPPKNPLSMEVLGGTKTGDSSSKMTDMSKGSTLGFNLDELTNLIALLLVFFLLMWLSRSFLKRGKALATEESDSSIRVISQKVVNLSPRQRIMVVETKGHTIVVGACDRGGLSHIAHLSTPLGPVGTTISSAPDPGGSGLDALGQLSGEAYHVPSGYYADDHYVSRDEGYHQSVMAHEDTGQAVEFEENTFVGDNDEDVFTVEMPVVSAELSMERDRMMDADSYSMGETPRSLASATSSQMTTPPDSLGGFSAEEDEEVKPENLLQLIQKLNSSKG